MMLDRFLLFIYTYKEYFLGFVPYFRFFVQRASHKMTNILCEANIPVLGV